MSRIRFTKAAMMGNKKPKEIEEKQRETTWIYRRVKKAQWFSVDKYNATDGKDIRLDYTAKCPTEKIEGAVGGWSIFKREDDYTTFRKKVWK